MAAPFHGSVTVAQDVLSELKQTLHTLSLPPLGPDFRTMSGAGLADALVAYRATKKYQAPSESDSARKARSIQKMLDFDQKGPVQVPSLRDIPLPIRRVLLHAKAWLGDTLRNYRSSNTCRFPTGESYTSQMGWVDVVAKLSSDTAWEVSMGCVTAAAGICYNNMQLKRLVKARFRSLRVVETRPRRWYEEARAAGRKVGFYVFTRMFLACCDIVGVSRVTTVPKDNEQDRVITCEPFWNMVVQLSVAQDLRSSLKSTRGITLETAQDLHRSLIAHDSIATIDFSNASNSNWLCWLRFLWPPRVLSKILEARTGLFEVEGEDGIEYHPVNMLAPMGCGFTFEVMTLTLLAISRSLDSGSRVFGDDVIIRKDVASEFIQVMDFLGWQINEKKTFVEGNFRESCGGFYSLPDRSYLVSYDFWWPETLGDVFLSIQKIENILFARQVSPMVSRPLARAWLRMIHAIPRDAIVGHLGRFDDSCCLLVFVT